MTTDSWSDAAAREPYTPCAYGIEHFKTAQSLVDGLDFPAAALVHAILALAAPAYGLHVPPFRPEPGKADTLANNKVNKPNGSEW